MFKLSRKRLPTGIFPAWIKDDSGAAALIIAAVVAVIAFTALSIFLNSFIGSRALMRAQSSGGNQALLVQAVYANFLGSSSHTLPCPDTAATPTGAAGTCNTSTPTAGVLPWVTLGLSKADVTDPYGNYYSYVVSGPGQTMCESVSSASSYSGVSAEFTGALANVTDLTLHTVSGETTAGGRKIAFAIIGHGPNRLGGKSAASNASTSAPRSGSDEESNKNAASGNIYTGLYSTVSTSYFDDEVYAPTNNEMEKVCKTLTTGGQLNATVSENFDSAAQRASASPTSSRLDSASTATIGVDARSAAGKGNYVAAFTTAGATLATKVIAGADLTSASWSFDPRVRRVYMSARWTPDPSSAVSSASTAGMSFATRATSADRTSTSDDFNSNTKYGITFRFNCGSAANDSSFCGTAAGANIDTSTTGVANHISIRDNAGLLGASTYSTGTYNLIRGKTYIIEAFDDGSNVWARITQEDSPSNTAYVSSSTTNDLAGSQQLIFVSQGAALSYLDDVTLGQPMLALETNQTTTPAAVGYATTSGPGNGFTSSSGAHSLSVEAWVRPRAFPTGTNKAVLVAKWDSSVAATANAYRLYLDSSGIVHFDLSGNESGDNQENYTTPLTLALDTWTHIAVTYDAPSQKIIYYQDGAAAGAATSAIDKTTGVTYETTRCFSVGAEFTDGGTCTGNGTAGDGFNGAISDVRVWQEARSADNIRLNYETRLAYTGTQTGALANLLVNWRLDPPTGSSTATFAAGGSVANTPSAIGAAGALKGNASYSATLALFFRPLSTAVCNGYQVGAYQCDFRISAAAGLASTLTIPSNLSEITVKAWGGGGGAYAVGSNSRNGGSAGYSTATIRTINSSLIASSSLDVLVGGYGTGSSTVVNNGAGGGGGSGVFSLANYAGVAAGGGGGASFSTDGACSSSSQCGLGGPGGGAGGSALTTTAPSQSLNCGGRGGDNSPTSAGGPSSSNSSCPSGGANPVGQLGGVGGGTNAGGGPTTPTGLPFLNGGSGSNGSSASRVGGGGGGGGATGGEAGGYKDTADYAGYGGGGGSGTADSAAVNVSGEAATLATSAGSFLDISHNGNFNNTTSITSITGLSTAGWSVGLKITGVGIPDGTTITAINTASNSITISQATTSGSNNVTLAVADYFYDISRKGNLTSNSTSVTVSPTTTGSSWAVGQTISGSGIPSGTTITAVSGTSVTLSQQATSSANNVNLTVYAAATSATTGGSTDLYNLPSYASSFLSPGNGGASGSVNGHAGAIVVFW